MKTCKTEKLDLKPEKLLIYHVLPKSTSASFSAINPHHRQNYIAPFLSWWPHCLYLCFQFIDPTIYWISLIDHLLRGSRSECHSEVLSFPSPLTSNKLPKFLVLFPNVLESLLFSPHLLSPPRPGYCHQRRTKLQKIVLLSLLSSSIILVSLNCISDHSSPLFKRF